jgi:hypothetical protein
MTQHEMSPHKRAVFDACINTGLKVSIYATSGGSIDLPEDVFVRTIQMPDGKEQTVNCGFVALEYELNLPKPIDDLDTNIGGIAATLSFGGQATKTFVPWDNIFGVFVVESGFASTWNVKPSEDVVSRPDTVVGGAAKPKLFLV